jgi:hypothetical protein
MPRFDLAAMAKRAGTRRKVIPFRPIKTTQTQANALAVLYRRAIEPWLTSRETIEAAYQRELDRVLQTDSIDDLAALFDELGDAVTRLVLNLTPNLRDFAFGVERWHRERWQGTVLSGAGVDLRYVIGPETAQETIEAFLGRNVALVKDIGAQAQGRISDAVFRGLQRRAPAREVGREIAGALGMARKRANRVAADQAVKLSSALDAHRQREAGLDYFKYQHSGKLHPRSWHKARDGRIYENDTLKEVVFEKGQPVFTGAEIDADDAPGQPPFCACVRVGVLVLDGEVL